MRGRRCNYQSGAHRGQEIYWDSGGARTFLKKNVCFSLEKAVIKHFSYSQPQRFLCRANWWKISDAVLLYNLTAPWEESSLLQNDGLIHVVGSRFLSDEWDFAAPKLDSQLLSHWLRSFCYYSAWKRQQIYCNHSRSKWTGERRRCNSTSLKTENRPGQPVWHTWDAGLCSSSLFIRYVSAEGVICKINHETPDDKAPSFTFKQHRRTNSP